MSTREWLYQSPDRLVGCAVAADVCVMAAFIPLALEHRRHALALPAAALFVGGALLSLIATSRLRDAVQNGRWPREVVEPWERRTRSAFWIAGPIIALAMMAVSAAASRNQQHGREGVLFWPCFIIVQTLSQIAIAFRQAPASASPGADWKSWDNLSTLHSDHWGER